MGIQVEKDTKSFVEGLLTNVFKPASASQPAKRRIILTVAPGGSTAREKSVGGMTFTAAEYAQLETLALRRGACTVEQVCQKVVREYLHAEEVPGEGMGAIAARSLYGPQKPAAG